MKYTLQEIAALTGGVLAGENRTVGYVTTDSRTAGEPDAACFVALRGMHRDGHDYISPQYRKGIRAFVVERPVEMAEYPGAGFVTVGDSLEALQTLAAHHRARFKGKVVAITGSNGKTVTKEWIAQLTPADLRLFRSPKSYNSQLGVPLSLLMLADEDVAVIEAGISLPGEMKRLEQIIRPDIGILTNIGDAHQENFRDVEQKLEEKLSLFEHAGTIIYVNDDPVVDRAVRRRFPDRELVAVNSEMYDLHELPMQDPASRNNITEAIALFEALGYLPDDITANLNQIQGVALRLELRDGIRDSRIVNDSYNSDINSLAIALDYLGRVAGGREKVLILSDMYQSGLPEEKLYAEIARLVRTQGVGRLIGIGPVISQHTAVFALPSDFYASTGEFMRRCDRSALAGKAILLKGSRVFGFERIGRMLESKVHTTALEVNLDHMIHNLNTFRSMLRPQVQVMAMVKAMGYGSGVFEVANALQQQGVEFLAVAFADEGVALREAGISMPVVVLNADNDSFDLMVEYRLEPEIYSFSSLAAFTEAVRRQGEQRYPVHVKLDTGMHRLGFTEEDIDDLLPLLVRQQALTVRSVFSHLAASENPVHDDFTREQIERFRRMSDRICAIFQEQRVLRHICNSGGIDRFSEAQFDMVRLGIGLYGIGAVSQERLLPVSTLKSRIVQIKELEPGETVGYGRYGEIDRPSRIATVPVGYADGLDRRLGRRKWSFRIDGNEAPIIGNICMDTCMVDVTGIDVREGDEVVIFGEGAPVVEMARRLDTIPYEILTGISARVKRIFIKE